MKEPDPARYGKRVRDLRIARGLSQTRLAELSGYSQTHIGFIEGGTMKRPERTAVALSEALRSPIEYLLWGTGPKAMGPPIMSDKQVREIYKTLPPEGQAAITAAITQLAEAAKEKHKSG